MNGDSYLYALVEAGVALAGLGLPERIVWLIASGSLAGYGAFRLIHTFRRSRETIVEMGVGRVHLRHLPSRVDARRLTARCSGRRAAHEGEPGNMRPLAIAVLLFGGAHAAVAQDAPGRLPDHDRLEHFVGRWTERGNEEAFVEVCAWFDGKFHVVCNAERKRADASIGRSLSILGYVPNEGYVHVGIGNRGGYETLQNGTFQEGVFEFLSTAREGGKSIVTRIRIGPFDEHGFPFVVDTSTDGGPWVAAWKTDYVRRQ